MSTRVLDPAAPAPERTGPPEPGRMTIRQHWDQSVRHQPAPPVLGAPSDGPVDDDDPRMRYHGSLGIVGTPDINHGLVVARRALRANRECQQGRIHLAVDGDSGTGKSAFLHALGRAHQGRIEKLCGADRNRMPVVCINTPLDPGDAVSWAGQIAVFQGWDPYRLDQQGQVVPRMKDWTGPVVQNLRACKTTLLLVDCVDQLRTADIRPAFTFLNYLSQEAGLTVVWCGVGAREILREARADRDRESGVLIPRTTAPTVWIRPIPYTPEEPEPWLRTLKGFDGLLCLHAHPRNALLAYAKLLHAISEGRMDILAPLIGQCGQIAIETGVEAITPDVIAEAADYLDLEVTATTFQE